MKWTNNVPKNTGFYWVRKSDLLSQAFSDYFEPCVKKIYVGEDNVHYWFVGNYEFYPTFDNVSGIVFEYSTTEVGYPEESS